MAPVVIFSKWVKGSFRQIEGAVEEVDYRQVHVYRYGEAVIFEKLNDFLAYFISTWSRNIIVGSESIIAI